MQALAELSQHQRTSASLQLHRAMLLANEQLAQSTEDLSSNKAALSWNRFTHSQDSLEKVTLWSFSFVINFNFLFHLITFCGVSVVKDKGKISFLVQGLLH